MKSTDIIIPLGTILLIAVYLYTKYPSIEGFTSYKRCMKLSIHGIMKEIFNNFNIKRTHSNKWDLYVPCGYNGVENEINQIKVSDEKQIIFGISGCDGLVSKNRLWLSLENKYGREYAKQIMPESWVLESPEHMKLFITNFRPKKTYILKKNIQRKRGLKLTSNLNEIINSKKEKYKVVQDYRDDTLLINKRKLNLRIYLLIVCKNGIVSAYINELAKCIYTNKDWDGGMDFETNITSYNMNQNIYKKNPFNLVDLSKYFNDHINTNLETVIEKINNKVKLLVLANIRDLCKAESISKNVSFQLFGLDVILMKNTLEPLILELNKGPDMKPKNKRDSVMKYTIQKDMFSLVGLIQPSLNKNTFKKIL